MITYRPEIDGLRAVAVVPVILYHADFPLFGGGYTGVDVFFVISGYLITRLILSDMEKGAFSLVDFYERRARRILPALFFVVFACLPVAWVTLLPYDAESFARSVLAVATFSSNILFWLESGYFGTVAELKPLLHTWSLAVEEQFYIAFPLLLLLVYPRGSRLLAIVVAAILVLSMILWFAIGRYDLNAAFYLMPTRMWELAAGSLLGLYHHKAALAGRTLPTSRRTAEVAAVFGLVLLLICFMTYDESHAAPGVWMALPVIGTALIIHFAAADTLARRVLRWQPVVFVGLLSYSAYLWHQPLFAFARHYSDTRPGHGVMIALIGLSMALAYLSWRFIERPFRRRGTLITARTVVVSAAGTIMFFSAIAVAGIKTDGFDYRNPPNVKWSSLAEKRGTLGPICKQVESEAFAGVPKCVFGDPNGKMRIALYGDSHAQSVSYLLDKKFKDLGIEGVLLLTARGCKPIPGIFDVFNPHDPVLCRTSFGNLLRFLETGTDGVIVVSRWTTMLYPTAAYVDRLTFDNMEGGREYGTYTEYAVLNADGVPRQDADSRRAAVRDFIDKMNSVDKPVFLVYPIPEVGWNIYKKNYRHFRENGAIMDQISTSFDLYKERNRLILEIFDTIQTDANIFRIRADKLFCDSNIRNRCTAQFDGVPLYLDDDHLSDAGANLIIDDILGTPFFMSSLARQSAVPGDAAEQSPSRVQ